MFQLDPQSIANRARSSPHPAHIPTLAESVLRGVIGFILVSLGGFAPWVLAGNWFYKNPGELAMYSACALVFLGLSGLFLHALIIGPGSFTRFYAVFCTAFILYSIGWITGWMLLRGHTGSLVGLLAGTVAMGIVFAIAFKSPEALLRIIAVLFITNALGYFLGGVIEGWLAQQKQINLAGLVLSGSSLVIFMKFTWAVCYGIGFGAGLGYAFFACQWEARALLAQDDIKDFIASRKS